jgi:hypothetical protein
MGTAFLVTVVLLIVLLMAYIWLVRKRNSYQRMEEEFFDE